MTEFAVLRAPSQVLFGAGMAAAAGRVAATTAAGCSSAPTRSSPRRRASPPSATRWQGEVAVFADAAVDVPRSAIDAAVALGRGTSPT